MHFVYRNKSKKQRTNERKNTHTHHSHAYICINNKIKEKCDKKNFILNEHVFEFFSHLLCDLVFESKIVFLFFLLPIWADWTVSEYVVYSIECIQKQQRRQQQQPEREPLETKGNNTEYSHTHTFWLLKNRYAVTSKANRTNEFYRYISN